MIEHWNVGRRSLSLKTHPLVMGILNVTPDSFSDGGRHNDPENAVRLAMEMQFDGAHIIDIGGESTRPYSDPVGTQEELDRVLPVIQELSGRLDVPLSIDTSKAEVADAAIKAGAEIVNDVTAMEGDPQMMDVVASNNVGVCLMHMQGSPQTMQDDPSYGNVVDEICDYLLERARCCLDAGIAKQRICLDPGIGFGKTHEHNLTLLRATRRFASLGYPLLIGHSRKGFIGKLLGDKDADRTAGTLGVSLAVAGAGAHIVRVHDVRQTIDALTLFRAAGGVAE